MNSFNLSLVKQNNYLKYISTGVGLKVTDEKKTVFAVLFKLSARGEIGSEIWHCKENAENHFARLGESGLKIIEVEVGP